MSEDGLPLVILAAGMGRRFGGSKQIEPIGRFGECIIDYSIYDALRAGFRRFILVIRRDMSESIASFVENHLPRQLQVEFAFQETENVPAGFAVPLGRTKPWGTGQAVLAAAECVKRPFGVINADDFYGRQSFLMLADHLRSCPAIAMVGFTLTNTLSEFGPVSRAICQVSPDGYVTHLEEHNGLEKHNGGARFIDQGGLVHYLSGQEVVSMNMWGFLPSVFAQLRNEFRSFLSSVNHESETEFYMPAVINLLIHNAQEKCRVLYTPEQWFGITYRDDQARAKCHITNLVNRGEYPERLFGGD